jgi:hypothetical protein
MLSFLYNNALWILLLGLTINYTQFTEELPPKFPVHFAQVHELSEGALLDSEGMLIESGFSAYPVKQINPENLAPVVMGFAPFTQFKFKQFEYQAINSGKDVIFFGLANIGWAGEVFMGTYNYDTNILTHDSQLTLPWQLVPMDTNAAMRFRRSLEYSKGGLRIRYKDTDVKAENKFVREYSIESAKLKLSGNFKFEVQYFSSDNKMPAYQGHLQVEPVEETQRFWHLGYKVYGLDVTGSATVGSDRLEFSKANNSLMMIDIGAGVFHYKTHWLWVTANFFLPDGRKMAFNFSQGITKTEKTKSNEDYIILDGHTQIMDPVNIKFDGRGQKKTSWSILTIREKENVREKGSSKLHLNPRFTTLQFKTNNTFSVDKNLGFAKFKLHQNFGVFSGTINTADGEKIEIDNVQGVCEFNYSQW